MSSFDVACAISLETDGGWEVCAEASDGREAVALAADLKPDVAIIDLSMPVMNGIEAMRQIRRVSPATDMLVCTMHDSEDLVGEAFAAGAQAFVRKSDAATLLISAVRAVTDGATPVGALRRPSSKAARRNPSHVSLTPREREILQLLAEGKTNGCIASALSISVKTVETHRAKVMLKLGFASIVELVRYAVRNQLVAP